MHDTHGRVVVADVSSQWTAGVGVGAVGRLTTIEDYYIRNPFSQNAQIQMDGADGTCAVGLDLIGAVKRGLVFGGWATETPDSH